MIWTFSSVQTKFNTFKISFKGQVGRNNQTKTNEMHIYISYETILSVNRNQLMAAGSHKQTMFTVR